MHPQQEDQNLIQTIQVQRNVIRQIKVATQEDYTQTPEEQTPKLQVELQNIKNERDKLVETITAAYQTI